MDDFNVIHGASAFIFATSILIIGVYFLCLYLVLDTTVVDPSARAHEVFSGSWPFSAVAAVWAVLCARVTYYASVGHRGAVSWKSIAVFMLLSVLSVGLVLSLMRSAGLGENTPWVTVFLFAGILTAAVLAGSRWSIDIQKPADGPAEPTGHPAPSPQL